MIGGDSIPTANLAWVKTIDLLQATGQSSSCLKFVQVQRRPSSRSHIHGIENCLTNISSFARIIQKLRKTPPYFCTIAFSTYRHEELPQESGKFQLFRLRKNPKPAQMKKTNVATEVVIKVKSSPSIKLISFFESRKLKAVELSEKGFLSDTTLGQEYERSPDVQCGLWSNNHKQVWSKFC